MASDSTLTDIIAKLRRGRFPSVCHPEPVEGSRHFSPPSHKGHQDRDRRTQPECSENFRIAIRQEAAIAGDKCHGSPFRGNPSPTIPEAWRELVESQVRRDAAVLFQPQLQELLVELLASAVESKAAFEPEGPA